MRTKLWAGRKTRAQKLLRLGQPRLYRTRCGEGCALLQTRIVNGFHVVELPAGAPRVTSEHVRKHRIRLADALALLRANSAHPSRRSWPDDIPFLQAVEPLGDRLVGHGQVSDSYLLV